jgi:hypothetical protein
LSVIWKNTFKPISEANLGMSVEYSTVRRLALAGMVFISLLGTALHFTYDLSDGNLLVAVFSAVNESVWEHLKLVFWPAAVFALIEIAYLRKIPSSFLPAKAVSMWLMPTVIVAMFYTSKLFIKESLAFDLFTFYFSIVLGQLVGLKIMGKILPKNVSYLALFAIASLASAFIYFTFYPPRIFLFQDPVTGGYGMNR